MAIEQHFLWENPLFQWPFSIAMVDITRGYWLFPGPWAVDDPSIGVVLVNGQDMKTFKAVLPTESGFP